MINEIKIHTTSVGPQRKPFIIAEMSGNHNQSLEKALQIVDAAAKSGVDAIKLQTYTAATLTIKGAYTITDKTSLWHGKELYDLYEQAYTPWEWHEALFKRAKENGIICFSSPFDETAVDFLEQFSPPVYKIASFENGHHPLLKKVAQTKKPVIMSTGVSSLSDLNESVAVLKENGCTQLILLKCTSTYPASPENSNLVTIPHLSELFNCSVGLSDHTLGIGVAVASVALGASIIEKHFTLRRSDGGVDSAFSMEPAEMKLLVEETERAWLSLGKVQYNVQQAEEKSLFFKRSIYVVKDMEAGEEFSKENIRVIRPGNGLAPKYFEKLIGKKTTKSYKAGTPLSFDSLFNNA